MQRPIDPEAVGEYLLEARKLAPSKLLSEVADFIPWAVMPEIDKWASLCGESVLEYRRELERREDKYAKAALRDIDAGEGVKGFDDVG